jgi:hypothetical protein
MREEEFISRWLDRYSYSRLVYAVAGFRRYRKIDRREYKGGAHRAI